MTPRVIGVRFSRVSKLYHFDASPAPQVRPGDHVLVETTRGRQLGEVVQFVEACSSPGGSRPRPVERLATPQDLALQAYWRSRETEATIECRARAAALNLRGVKIVRALYNFDGSLLTFLYSVEGDERADIRSLPGDMQAAYPRAVVELRQIGPRDVAKLLGGMGACGLETRCCSMFLTEFSPISIKMAKAQGISLNPEEITGMCGRLRCCLIYEYEQYVQARKGLPKRGKRTLTPQGEGRVVDVLPLKGTVVVDLGPEVGRVEFGREDLQPKAELEALAKKAQAPCDRHEGGGCTCGKDRKRSH
ncbi:MAG: stage 0 sporulation protein [Chloroflexi bacterium]|nr:stage 0 sporulation protein [Chloroflexota bacterium]